MEVARIAKYLSVLAVVCATAVAASAQATPARKVPANLKAMVASFNQTCVKVSVFGGGDCESTLADAKRYAKKNAMYGLTLQVANFCEQLRPTARDGAVVYVWLVSSEVYNQLSCYWGRNPIQPQPGVVVSVFFTKPGQTFSKTCQDITIGSDVCRERPGGGLVSRGYDSNNDQHDLLAVGPHSQVGFVRKGPAVNYDNTWFKQIALAIGISGV